MNHRKLTTIPERPVHNIGFLKTNEFVGQIIFEPGTVASP